MQRKPVFAAGILAFILSLAGISGCQRAPEPPPPATKQAVTFLHYFTGSLSGGIAEMAQAFNERNSRFELKSVAIDHEAFKTSIQDTLKAGYPPELYSYWAGARTASVVEHLEPIDDIWRQAKLDELFSSAVTQAGSEYGGKKYLIPLTQHYIALFYNKKVFDEHHLTPPRTWSEFLSVCATLKAKGIVPLALGAQDKWPAQFWFDFLLLRTAPYEFRQQLMQGKARFDDPRVARVFQLWNQLIDKGYFNAQPHPNDLGWDSGANEMVFKGQAAMTLMGTWNIGYFTNEAHRWQAGRDFDFFPFPTIDPALPVVAMGPIDGVILPKRSANVAGAKEAMIHLADLAAQRAFSRGSGALSPNVKVPLEDYSDIQLRVRSEIAKSPIFTFAFDLAAPPAVAEAGLNAFSEFLAFPSAYPKIMKKLAEDAEAAHSSTPSSVR